MKARAMSWRRAFQGELVLISALGGILLALIALDANGLPAPLAVVRMLLGLAYVLFVPGYTLQLALFPRSGDLDGAERVALSFSLSVALAPALALVLDHLPWGLRLWPIAAAEGLTIAGASVVAWWRLRRLAPEDRAMPHVDLSVSGRWAAQDRTNRLLYGVLAGALLMAAAAAAAILLLPKAGDRFTEFYALGAESLAEAYPRETAAGQLVTVTIGIANREGVPVEYRVDVQAGGHLLATAGPVALGEGQVWEQALSYALPQAGDDQAVEFLLYRDGGNEPYRRLVLWIDVVEEPE
jgi:uncharacterized membrane protein